MTSTTQTALGSFIKSALALVKQDGIKEGLPVVTSFLTNIQGNTSTANLAAQVAALQVNLLAALPNLEQAVVHDLAGIVQTEVNTLATDAQKTSG